MTNELEHVAEWARDRIRSGLEPPWAYYKLTQLVDAVEGLREDDPTKRRMENSLQSPEPRRDAVPQLSGQVVSLDAFRHPLALTPESQRT